MLFWVWCWCSSEAVGYNWITWGEEFHALQEGGECGWGGSWWRKWAHRRTSAAGKWHLEVLVQQVPQPQDLFPLINSIKFKFKLWTIFVMFFSSSLLLLLLFCFGIWYYVSLPNYCINEVVLFFWIHWSFFCLHLQVVTNCESWMRRIMPLLSHKVKNNIFVFLQDTCLTSQLMPYIYFQIFCWLVNQNWNIAKGNLLIYPVFDFIALVS